MRPMTFSERVTIGKTAFDAQMLDVYEHSETYAERIESLGYAARVLVVLLSYVDEVLADRRADDRTQKLARETREWIDLAFRGEWIGAEVQVNTVMR